MKIWKLILLALTWSFSQSLVNSFEIHFGNHMMDNPEDLPDVGDPETPSTIINLGGRTFHLIDFNWIHFKPGLGMTYYRTGFGNSSGFLFNEGSGNGTDWTATELDTPVGFRNLIETYELELLFDVSFLMGNNDLYLGMMYTLPLFGQSTIYSADESTELSSETIGFLGSTEQGYDYNNMLYLRVGYKYFFSGKYGVGFEFNKGLTNFLTDGNRTVGNSTKNAFNILFEYVL